MRYVVIHDLPLDTIVDMVPSVLTIDDFTHDCNEC